MAVNKVIYSGSPLIDLSLDTVTEDVLLKGYTAHDKSGKIIQGSHEDIQLLVVGSEIIFDEIKTVAFADASKYKDVTIDNFYIRENYYRSSAPSGSLTMTTYNSKYGRYFNNRPTYDAQTGLLTIYPRVVPYQIGSSGSISTVLTMVATIYCIV